MTEERIQKLNDLGFVGPIRVAVDWDGRFEQLRAFQKEHGHCQVVPITEGARALSGRLGKYSDTHGLFDWVNSQRRSISISEERIDKWNDLGFEWVLQKRTPWGERFEELKAFQKEHGHCRVPPSTGKESDTHKLYHWVSYQRRSASISEERIQKLNALGFEWVLRKRGTPPGMKDSTQRPFRRSTGT
jgi:hypothetical protein